MNDVKGVQSFKTKEINTFTFGKCLKSQNVSPHIPIEII